MADGLWNNGRMYRFGHRHPKYIFWFRLSQVDSYSVIEFQQAAEKAAIVFSDGIGVARSATGDGDLIAGLVENRFFLLVRLLSALMAGLVKRPR